MNYNWQAGRHFEWGGVVTYHIASKTHSVYSFDVLVRSLACAVRSSCGRVFLPLWIVAHAFLADIICRV